VNVFCDCVRANVSVISNFDICVYLCWCLRVCVCSSLCAAYIRIGIYHATIPSIHALTYVCVCMCDR